MDHDEGASPALDPRPTLGGLDAPMSKTRGSERRARNGWLAMRSSAEEEALIRKKAADAGISVSELMRAATLGYRPPASKIDVAALTNMLREIGKIGSNINQIA